MNGRTKLPNPRRRGEPITLDWIRSNCEIGVRAIPMTECWTWLGHVGAEGYGQIGSKIRKERSPHRFAALTDAGIDDTSLHVDHVCRNRACCNPAHLQLVTNHENTIRGDAAGIARNVGAACRVCGGTRKHSSGHAGRRWHVSNVRCADCNARITREWRARKRMEASLA